MSWLDRLAGFLKREAADLADMADSAKDRLDQELTKREADLDKTPSERIQDLQRDAERTGERFDEIVDKAEGRLHDADAQAEVRDAVDAAATDLVRADDGGASELAEAISDPDAGEESFEPSDPSEPSEPSGPPEPSEPSGPPEAISDPDAGEESSEPSEPSEPNEERVEPDFTKSAAQVRYEQARAKADDLLDELRTELAEDE